MFSIASSRLVRALLLGAVASTFAAASAQSAPHLSVNSRAVGGALPAYKVLTSSMCNPSDEACFAANYATLTSGTAQAFDPLGNLYVSTNDGVIMKINPTGAATLYAGLFQIGGGLAATGPNGPAHLYSFHNPNSIAADGAGNVYVADNFGFTAPNALLRIDPLGMVTALTASSATKSPKDGAAANTQYVSAASAVTDAAGNVYFADRLTCTVREYVPATGALKVIAGTLTGCSPGYNPPATSQPATTYSFAQILNIAIGLDGTIFLTDGIFNRLFSITPDGTVHFVAGTAAGAVNYAPIASGGDIGNPTGGLAVDAADNVYLTGYTSNNHVAREYILEVTKGTPSSPAQILPIAGNYNAQTFTMAPAGTPSTISPTELYPPLALDPFGRLFLAGPTSNFNQYLDRNGAVVFDAALGYSTQTITFTNSGGSTLHGVPFGGTGYPFLIGPSDADIAAAGEKGKQPFSVSQNDGSCLAKFATGTFALDPGESCTVVIEYAPNDDVPPAGVLSFFTDDPLGPLSVSLSATPLQPSSEGSNFAPVLTVSNVVLKPQASSSRSGSFAFSASVLSSIANNGKAATQTPTGTIVLGLVNQATGVHSNIQVQTLDQFGAATFKVTGLANGTYLVSAVYEGDGNSAPAYSPFQTLLVGNTIDFTATAATGINIPYEGASGQFLNLGGSAYTVPGTVLEQDLEAGNTAINFSLTDQNNKPVFSFSNTPLAVGQYSVHPLIPNPNLNYSASLRNGVLTITKADLTITDASLVVPYGKLLTSGTADASHFSLSSVPQFLSGQAVAQADVTAGYILLTTSISGAPSDPTQTPLPVGQYSLVTTLSGGGAGNYSYTNHPGTLYVQRMDLTVRNGTTSARYGQLLTSSANPNASQFTLAANPVIVTNSTGIQNDLSSGALVLNTSVVNPPVDPTTSYLQVGSYTVSTVPGGSAAPDYSYTDRTGLLFMQKADLTMRLKNTTIALGTQPQVSTLCGAACYTAPNTQLLTQDVNLQITIAITQPGNPGFSRVVAWQRGLTHLPILPAGTYTVTPSLGTTGSSPNYGLTPGSATLTVH